MLIFMNMRDIFLQLNATDPTRLKIDHGPTSLNQIQKLNKNKLTAKNYVQPTQKLNKHKLTATNHGLLWNCDFFLEI
jgi:hypothetical protein